VYGDNWFQSVKYSLRCLVAVPPDTDCVTTIKSSEEKLAMKKKELETFQSEFCEIKKKYDAAKERLENDVKEITELIQVGLVSFSVLVKHAKFCRSEKELTRTTQMRLP
jgi:hypothetical protein